MQVTRDAVATALNFFFQTRVSSVMGYCTINNTNVTMSSVSWGWSPSSLSLILNGTCNAPSPNSTLQAVVFQATTVDNQTITIANVYNLNIAVGGMVTIQIYYQYVP